MEKRNPFEEMKAFHISSPVIFPSLFPSLLPPSLHPFLLFPLSLPLSSQRSRQSLPWGPECIHRESQSPLMVRDHSVHVYCCLLLFIWSFICCLLVLDTLSRRCTFNVLALLPSLSSHSLPSSFISGGELH